MSYYTMLVSIHVYLLQIVEQLEDGTVQILDQPVEEVDREVQYITDDQIVLQRQ